MGCDIHCYIEYSSEPQPGTTNRYWFNFGGRINPGRDYDLFTKIAGVRSYGETKQMFEPRGIPDDIGWETKGDYLLRVVEAEEDYVDGEGVASLAKAEKWVARGISRWVALEEHPQYYVTGPDWHSATWLTPNEWWAVLEAPRPASWGGIDDDYYAMLAAMQEFQKRGKQVRVVIWFDN